MTRDEFARYCFEGEQWTPATMIAVRMAQSGFLPVRDAATFEVEAVRPNGFIEYIPMKPLFVRGDLGA